MIPLVLEMATADIHLSDEQFYRLCQVNRDLRLERTAEGKLIIMPPTGWETGTRNSRLTQRLSNWADKDGRGLVFDSSTGFILPNGAIRSPDAAWVERERLETLRPDPDRFLPVCPDFAVELCSATDDLNTARAKMQEYLENGMRLGWLFDPYNQQVEVYRAGRFSGGKATPTVEILKSPTELSGESVLPEFVLQLDGILM